MIVHFLGLHFKQLGRFFQEIGIARSLVLLLLAAFTLARAFTLETPFTYALAAFVVFLIASLHVFRPDKAFLQLLGVQRYRLYAAEYHLLASPVYIKFLLDQRWAEFVVTLAVVFLIPLISTRFRSRTGVSLGFRMLPAQAFEWRSGLRKQGGWLGVIYLSALALYSYPFAAVVAIVVFTFIVSTFYNETESRPMVEAFATSPAAFLWAKARVQLTIFWVGCMPLVLTFLLTNADYWYVLLVWMIVSSIIQLLSINLKYALYDPGATLNTYVFMFIYFLSLFVPYFVPVPLVMLIYYHRKARHNLKAYLHDSP